MTTIRRAKPADSRAASELIVMASSRLIGYLFHGNIEQALSVLEHWFARSSHDLSFDLAWIAEEGGAVASLMHGFPGRDEFRLELAMLKLVPPGLQIVGAKDALRILWRVRRFSGRLQFPRKREDYLVNVLAVYERFRRQGIATRLLEVAEEQARSLGLPRLRLIARVDNTPAVAAYEKFGFVMLDEVHSRLDLGGGPQVVWSPMEKTLM